MFLHFHFFARMVLNRGFFCCLVECLKDACTDMLNIWFLVSAGLKSWWSSDLAHFKNHFQIPPHKKKKKMQVKPNILFWNVTVNNLFFIQSWFLNDGIWPIKQNKYIWGHNNSTVYTILVIEICKLFHYFLLLFIIYILPSIYWYNSAYAPIVGLMVFFSIIFINIFGMF